MSETPTLTYNSLCLICHNPMNARGAQELCRLCQTWRSDEVMGSMILKLNYIYDRKQAVRGKIFRGLLGDGI